MSIKIKKIDKMFSFCGLNEVCIDREFEGYNVFFADNGVGKTSVTRAFELLIKQNSQHISRYKTIDSQDDPQISFLTDSGAITIDSASSATNLPFKIEIYNSDFLIQNAPLSSDFALKKLDDKTIVLSDSYLGEETKEEKNLNQEKDKLKKRKDEINGSKTNPNIKEDEITKTKKDEENVCDEIEKIRKNITTREIQINLNEIEIKSDALNGKNNFNVDEKELQEKQSKFTELNNAIKSFADLPDINFPNLKIEKEKLTSLFEFDIEKEAGKVSENVKNHIIKVGKDFIESGRKIIDTNKFNICPFCMQPIENGVLNEYSSYFNDVVSKFNNTTQTINSELTNKLRLLNESKNDVMNGLENFKPFMPSNYEQTKSDFKKNIESLGEKLEQIIKLVRDKKGIGDLDKFIEALGFFESALQACNEVVKTTQDILKDKKAQQDKLEHIKNELKNLRIQKAKRDSFDAQKRKQEILELLNSLNDELNKIDNNIKVLDDKLQTLRANKKPDIKVINSYLRALNLTKYSVNSDYQLIINQKIISNDDVRMVLSDGEKTTLAFAYFLARLKLFYNKGSLKNLVIVIDDPITSLDDSRIYTTSYLVAKINQEIAGEILEKEEDKAQVFVLTHNHVFMTNIIRILGKYASYQQISRDNDRLIFESKDKVAGYFDTFYMLLFKDVIKFANEENLVEDYNRALNNGNKIRILLESFIKTNFISQFIANEYTQQHTFTDKTLEEIINAISAANQTHKFKSDLFSQSDYDIVDGNDLKKKLIGVIKGLHMDSHGSIADFYSQHKISLSEVQKFAKIAINAMNALNPNQVYFYIEASKNE